MVIFKSCIYTIWSKTTSIKASIKIYWLYCSGCIVLYCIYGSYQGDSLCWHGDSCLVSLCHFPHCCEECDKGNLRRGSYLGLSFSGRQSTMTGKSVGAGGWSHHSKQEIKFGSGNRCHLLLIGAIVPKLPQAPKQSTTKSRQNVHS